MMFFFYFICALIGWFGGPQLFELFTDHNHLRAFKFSCWPWRNDIWKV